MNESAFIDLQKDVAMRVKADPFFSGVAVITDREEDLSALISSALNVVSPSPDGSGRSGACVIVLQPFANDANIELPGGPLDFVVSILCLEQLLINRDATRGTNKSVRAMAQRLHKLFKHYTANGLFSNFIPQEPFITDASAEIARQLEDDMLRGLDVRFGTRQFDDELYRKAATPVITTAGGQVTITCATDAVDIWVTFDRSNPAPSAINPAAVKYTGAFTPPGPCLIRAGAYRQQATDEWIPSDTATLRWNVLLADELGVPLGTEEQNHIQQ